VAASLARVGRYRRATRPKAGSLDVLLEQSGGDRAGGSC